MRYTRDEMLLLLTLDFGANLDRYAAEGYPPGGAVTFDPATLEGTGWTWEESAPLRDLVANGSPCAR